MKKLLFVFAVLTFVACKDKDNDLENLPTCILEMIDNDSSSDNLKSIQVQTIDGDVHYWLNTGVIPVDGTEYIVNDACEKLCTIGGLLPSVCPYEYDADNWEIVWEE
ncbi:MAG: hypothetical protein AB8F74_12150 [Saprospiraceae bacterium]